MDRKSNFYYNWMRSQACPAGSEWVTREDDTTEPGGEGWDDGSTIYRTEQRRLTVAELPTWADELWTAYAGPDAPCVEDRAEFVAWLGVGGEAVAKKIDWLG